MTLPVRTVAMRSSFRLCATHTNTCAHTHKEMQEEKHTDSMCEMDDGKMNQAQQQKTQCNEQYSWL